MLSRIVSLVCDKFVEPSKQQSSHGSAQFVLFQEDSHGVAFPLAVHLLSRLTDTASKAHVVVVALSLTRRQLEARLRPILSRIRCTLLNCSRDPHNWLKPSQPAPTEPWTKVVEFAHATQSVAALLALVQDLLGSSSAPVCLFIDSLQPLFVAHGQKGLEQFLLTLLSSPAGRRLLVVGTSQAGKEQGRLVWRSLSSTWIAVTARATCRQLHMVHRRAVAKPLEARELYTREWRLAANETRSIAEKKTKEEVHEGVSFNVHVNPRQRAQRANTDLPYEHQGLASFVTEMTSAAPATTVAVVESSDEFDSDLDADLDF